MDYTVSGRDIILKQPDFDLAQTLDCGQAFRWSRCEDGDGSFEGYYLNHYLHISREGEEGVFRLHDTTEVELLDVWYNYLDLSTDYGELKRRFYEDETLARACEYAGGIRLLRQDSWEALSSFIISQNNNIPRIKGIIGRLCEHWGGYPSLEDLRGETAESLGFLRSGFRAKYLVDAVEKLSDGTLSLERIKTLPIAEAEAELRRIKGVGAKVANCALLFGMYRTEAFPIDVWMKRALERWYPNGLPDCTKGVEGIAQQYLFHYIRTAAPKEQP